MEIAICAALTGIGATAIIDAWSLVRRRLFGTPLPSYALVGRWLAHMLRGRFRHPSIARAAPVRGELAAGWAAHYLTGIVFAGALLAVAGPTWLQRPTLAPALAVGLGTVLAPFLLMQPGMGAGVAARRTPRPGAARLQSIATHAIFGLGLYAAGWCVRLGLLQ